MFKIIFGLSSIVMLLAGCAQRENMDIPSGFLSQPKSIVITKISGLEEPDLYKQGPQGLLDVVINEALTDSVSQKIRRIDASDVLDTKYYKQFDQAFVKYTFTVVNDFKGLNKGGLSKAPEDDIKFAPHGLIELKRKFNVDYALVLYPQLFGASRQYYGFIPLGEPKGFAHIIIYLVELESNKLLGYYNSVVTVPVKNDWDNPPEYYNLTTACKTALADAIDNACGFFFMGR